MSFFINIFIIVLLYGLYTGFGITGGIHRYWTHRTYKAKTPLRLFLAGAYYGAGMVIIFPLTLKKKKKIFFYFKKAKKIE